MKRDPAFFTLLASLAMLFLGGYSYVYGGALLGMLQHECPPYGSEFLTPRCAQPLFYIQWGARLGFAGALTVALCALWLVLRVRAKRQQPRRSHSERPR